MRFRPRQQQRRHCERPSSSLRCYLWFPSHLIQPGDGVRFAVALLVSSLSIARQLAFEIFLGLCRIRPYFSAALVQGMHSALLASISLLAVAPLLSILRGKEVRAERELTR